MDFFQGGTMPKQTAAVTRCLLVTRAESLGLSPDGGELLRNKVGLLNPLSCDKLSSQSPQHLSFSMKTETMNPL